MPIEVYANTTANTPREVWITDGFFDIKVENKSLLKRNASYNRFIDCKNLVR